MAYNLEKYRDKREKVLGVRKRGLSFGTVAVLVSGIILLGLSSFVIPKSLAYFSTRNLDDAIFKLQEAGEWPHSLITELKTVSGVKNAVTDSNNKRLIVTFDRTETKVNTITSLFNDQGLTAIMLNRMNHNQRKETIKEEAEFEAL